MSDLTILTCNYNTPELICYLKKSIDKFSNLQAKFLVVNTSSNDDSEKILDDNNIQYINFKKQTHGRGVNFGLQNVTTRYVLLLDSDIIITSDVSDVYKRFVDKGLALAGRVVGDEGGKKLHSRVDPSFCFIDNDVLKQHGIVFFDEERTKLSRKTGDRVYNIGSTMYEDVKNNKLLIGDFDLRGKRFIHYEGMSWRVQSFNPNQGDTDIDFGGTHPNAGLKQIGEQVLRQYYHDIKHFF